jgi:NADH-quinone oxidoreductase subunit G
MGIHPALLPGYKPVKEPGMEAKSIYEAAQSGALQALYVLGADPVGDGLMPGRGKLDFLVVQELFLTDTAAEADVVLPAQSWAERDGTFTSGERRVQRYYPAIPPAAGTGRPDWQILAQVGERVGIGKAPIAAGQVFSELAKAAPQYQNISYRSLARVEPQLPVITEDDVYYGGTVVANRSGLGQQWPVGAPGSVAEWQGGADRQPVGRLQVAGGGLQVARIAALYTPGTLIKRSVVVASRLARPTLILNCDDADALGLREGDLALIAVAGREFRAAVAPVDAVASGLALLRGVPYFPGLVEARISKLEMVETLDMASERELLV